MCLIVYFNFLSLYTEALNLYCKTTILHMFSMKIFYKTTSQKKKKNNL